MDAEAWKCTCKQDKRRERLWGTDNNVECTERRGLHNVGVSSTFCKTNLNLMEQGNPAISEEEEKEIRKGAKASRRMKHRKEAVAYILQ